MSRKHKKTCTNLNYIEHFLILASTISGCIPISVFASLIGIPIGIKSSAIGLKICAIAARTKKYKSIIPFPNWSEEVFVITKVKNTALWTCAISDLKGKEIAGTFYKKKIKENLELKKK